MFRQGGLVFIACMLAAQAGAWSPDCGRTPDFGDILDRLNNNPFLNSVITDDIRAMYTFDPSACDLNGYITLEPDLVVHGNAMLDERELALIQAIIANPKLDFSAAGGVSHAIVHDAWCVNLTAIFNDIYGGSRFHWLYLIAPEFPLLLTGYATLGDIESIAVVMHLLEMGKDGLGDMGGNVGLPDLEACSRLPQYLSWAGDADADGATNYSEYLWAGPENYLTVALDSQQHPPISEGEGEGEGETPSEGEAEGEGETPSEGEGELPSEGEAEGEGELPAEGEAEGEGETPSEGEAEGEGELPSEGEAEGEGELPSEGEAEGEGEIPSEGEAEGEGETPAEGEAEGEGETPAEGEGESSTPDDALPSLMLGCLNTGLEEDTDWLFLAMAALVLLKRWRNR